MKEIQIYLYVKKKSKKNNTHTHTKKNSTLDAINDVGNERRYMMVDTRVHAHSATDHIHIRIDGPRGETRLRRTTFVPQAPNSHRQQNLTYIFSKSAFMVYVEFPLVYAE